MTLCQKSFISTFARAKFFTIHRSFLLISRNLKVEKPLVFFSKSVNLWKKIFISRYDMIMFICKSWSINSGWLILFLHLNVTRGDSFALKTLLNVAKFLGSTFLIKKKKVNSSTLSLQTKAYYFPCTHTSKSLPEWSSKWWSTLSLNCSKFIKCYITE